MIHKQFLNKKKVATFGKLIVNGQISWNLIYQKLVKRSFFIREN